MIEIQQKPVKNGVIRSRQILGDEFNDFIKSNNIFDSLKSLEEDDSDEEECDQRKLNFLKKVSSLPSLSEVNNKEGKKKGVKFLLENQTQNFQEKFKDELKDEEDDKSSHPGKDSKLNELIF